MIVPEFRLPVFFTLPKQKSEATRDFAKAMQLPDPNCLRLVLPLLFPPRGELVSLLQAGRRFTEATGAAQGEAELAMGLRIGRVESGGGGQPFDGRRALPLAKQFESGVEGEEGRLSVTLELVESRRFGQRDARAGEIALLPERRAEGIVVGRTLWGKRNRRAQRGDGSRQIPLLLEGRSEQVVRFGKVALRDDCSPQRLDRLRCLRLLQ